MPNTRDQVFDRITVDHLFRGGTRVSWSLRSTFTDPAPHTFQLQVGQTGNNDADDWADVGIPVSTFFAVDSEQRIESHELTTHYRVVLTTPLGTYTSEPEFTYGLLSKRDWLKARAIARREQLMHRVKTSANGYLLKRKRAGAEVTSDTEVDPLTGEVTDPFGDTGLGTTFIGGYYDPVAMRMMRDPEARYPHQDDSGNRGTVDDKHRIRGRALAFPQISHKDVWVDATSDRRYEVHGVQHAAEVRGVPIVVIPELRLLPGSDPVYEIAVP